MDPGFTVLATFDNLPEYLQAHPPIWRATVRMREMVDRLFSLCDIDKSVDTISQHRYHSQLKEGKGLVTHELEVRMTTSKEFFESVLASLMVAANSSAREHRGHESNGADAATRVNDQAIKIDAQHEADIQSNKNITDVNEPRASFEWTESPSWATMHDIHHLVPGTGIVRTTVYFENKKKCKPVHIIKKAQETFDLEVERDMSDPREIPNLRCQMSTEQSVTDLPDATEQKFARIKLRKIFRYHNYAYMLTMSWEGATLNEAEKKQKANEPPKYEIEVELEDPCSEILRLKKDPLLVATTIMLKVYSLLPPLYDNSLNFEWRLKN